MLEASKAEGAELAKLREERSSMENSLALLRAEMVSVVSARDELNSHNREQKQALHDADAEIARLKKVLSEEQGRRVTAETAAANLPLEVGHERSLREQAQKEGSSLATEVGQLRGVVTEARREISGEPLSRFFLLLFEARRGDLTFGVL